MFKFLILVSSLFFIPYSLFGVVFAQSIGVVGQPAVGESSNSNYTIRYGTMYWIDNPPTGGAVCGNNIKEGTEQCDSADLGGQTCVGLGFSGGGNLSCNANCTFNTSSCSSGGGGGGGGSGGGGSSGAGPWVSPGSNLENEGVGGFPGDPLVEIIVNPVKKVVESFREVFSYIPKIIPRVILRIKEKNPIVIVKIEELKPPAQSSYLIVSLVFLIILLLIILFLWYLTRKKGE